jgi:hypothetical protein
MMRYSTQTREDLDIEPERKHQHQDTKLDHLGELRMFSFYNIALFSGLSIHDWPVNVYAIYLLHHTKVLSYNRTSWHQRGSMDRKKQELPL